MINIIKRVPYFLLTTGLVLGSVKLGITAPIHPDLSWRTIHQDLLNRQDDPPLGSRPVKLCLITPEYHRNSVTLWQNRPLFVWQGKIGGIGIRPANNEQIIWRQPIAMSEKSVNRVAYTGDPLEPGQTYHWLIFDQADDSQPIRFIPFTILAGKQRDRIRVRLIILAAQLREKGATAEEMALERANYFNKQELWSDALQEVYRVDNPSTELETMIAELSTQLCS